MEFSEPFTCTKNLCTFSPDGRFIASVKQLEVHIRSVDTLVSAQSYQCADKLDYIEWSQDSLYILCASYSNATVSVFSIENPPWKCKITEAASGLVKAFWSPDSRHVLTVGKFHILLSIWSLVDESVSYVHYTKEGNPGMAFSSDGSYLAVLERRGVKDHVLILPCSTWTPYRRLECPGFINVGGLAWYPDNSGICIWETPPEEGLKILWLEGGSKEGVPTSKTPVTLGVRCVSWSATGQFLAFGANDRKVHLLQNITWRTICKFSHEQLVSNCDCEIYSEALSVKFGNEKPTYKLLDKRPAKISPSKENDQKLTLPLGQLNPRGIRKVIFCPSGAWLASQEDSCPTALWVWSIARLKLKAVIVHKETISDFSWSPAGDGTLVLCSSNKNVSFWTPKGGTIIVPTGITEKITRIKWHPSGKTLLLLGRGEAVLCLTRES